MTLTSSNGRTRPRNGAWFRKVKRLRERLRAKQGNVCPFCQRAMTTPTGPDARDTDCTLEHVRPLSLGGQLNEDDCVAACWDCNQRRNCTMQVIAA